jgi:hypothetical protein
MKEMKSSLRSRIVTLNYGTRISLKRTSMKMNGMPRIRREISLLASSSSQSKIRSSMLFMPMCLYVCTDVKSSLEKR